MAQEGGLEAIAKAEALVLVNLATKCRFKLLLGRRLIPSKWRITWKGRVKMK